MFHYFKYRELICTYSLKTKIEVCNILEDNNIDYSLKNNGLIMRNLGSRGVAIDQFGENLDCSCEYKILVSKKNFEEAQYLIRSLNQK